MAVMGGTMLKNAVLTGVLVCLGLSTTGCKNLLKKKLGGDAGATGDTTATGQDHADEQLQGKLDEYIKCLNSLSSPIHQSRQRYLTYVPRTGPKGTEANADLYKLSPGLAATCSAGAAKAKALPPTEGKLETAGADFAAAAVEIDKLMAEMDTYYELRLFKSDKWEKGKAEHPKLMTAWDHFSKADKALHDALDGITKPLAQRTLARIEREDGKRFSWNRKKVLITARDLIESSDPVGDDDDVDANLYTAAYTDFEKSLDELSAYGSMHKTDLSKPTNPAFPMSDSNYTSFVKEAGDFKKAAKDFWRCLQDAPAKAKTPSGKIDMEKVGACGGAPAWKTADNVIKQYNEFIQTSNSKQFP